MTASVHPTLHRPYNGTGRTEPGPPPTVPAAPRAYLRLQAFTVALATVSFGAVVADYLLATRISWLLGLLLVVVGGLSLLFGAIWPHRHDEPQSTLPAPILSEPIYRPSPRQLPLPAPTPAPAETHVKVEIEVNVVETGRRLPTGVVRRVTSHRRPTAIVRRRQARQRERPGMGRPCSEFPDRHEAPTTSVSGREEIPE